VWLLAGSAELVITLLGFRGRKASSVTEEDIHDLLIEGSDAGVIETHEQIMVHNLFRLDDRQLGSLMVPCGEVICLDAGRPWKENLERIEHSLHTRFPVVRGGMGEILGVISTRLLLEKVLHGEPHDLKSDLQPAVFVPASLTGLELLQAFRSSGLSLVFVVDEYGEALGIVTLQDMLEAITGEFSPRHGEAPWAVQRDDGSWLLDGLVPIPLLKDRLGLRQAPEEERYHTLSGMLLVLLGRLPLTGDRTEWENWRFEVVDMDGKRIDTCL
jgi:putative hemolysin